MLAAKKAAASKAKSTAKSSPIATKTTVKTMTKPKKRVPAPTKRAMDVFVGASPTDVNGSYTGVPKNIHETPVQDADDL